MENNTFMQAHVHRGPESRRNMRTPKMLRVLSFALLFALAGCSDIVESRYSTRAEAEADSLFERGWLPSIVPDSARDIVTRNNLDLNVSNGTFFFSPEDFDDFTRHLDSAGKGGPETSSFTYSEGGRRWCFEIDPGSGHCKYSMSWKR